MHRPRRHKLITQIWIQISSISDDDAHIESQRRLGKSLQRSKTDTTPPPIKLIPDRPPGIRASRLKKLHCLGSGYRSDRIDPLPFKVDRIVESTRIQRPTRTAQHCPKADPIALEEHSIRCAPGQPNMSGSS